MKFTLGDYTVAPAPTFELPADNERRSLRVGQFAKLTFCFEDADPERMWVCVTEVLPDGHYRGTLANNGAFVDMQCGLPVDFAWNNVISIILRSEEA